MPPLLIFGASTRAAAYSAIRAGFGPICGDMFADADLRVHAAEILHVPDYPQHLTDAARHHCSVPWIYTGALENSPGMVASLSARHRLWGNPADVLRGCRDPWKCSAILLQHQLPTLELRASSDPPPRDFTWLVKPLRSAGGREIGVWGRDTAPPAEPYYFQRYVAGTAISGSFLASAGEVRLLGISQQLTGMKDLHASPFGYCGSLFPATVELTLQSRIEQLGRAIARGFGLRGLFGIDFIQQDNHVWMTEINPRYTASMELLEYGLQRPLIEYHRAACDESAPIADVITVRGQPAVYCAKVVLYADRHVRAPDLSAWIPPSVTLDDLPRLADIPVQGTEILPGQPAYTCLGTGTDSQGLVDSLIGQATRLWDTFETL